MPHTHKPHTRLQTCPDIVHSLLFGTDETLFGKTVYKNAANVGTPTDKGIKLSLKMSLRWLKASYIVAVSEKIVWERCIYLWSSFVYV
jgi:hypothetical protein